MEWTVHQVEREGLPQKVIAKVRRSIAAGEWQAGSKLPPERELTTLFGVSRTALREALGILSAYGVLRIRHGGGIYLAHSLNDSVFEPLGFFLPVNGDTLLELMAVRKLLEVGAAELAAKMATDADIREMAQAVDDLQDRRASLEDLVQAGIRFHVSIVKAARNKLLQRLTANLVELFLVGHRATTSTKEGLRMGVRDHLEIMRAIQSRDPEKAKGAMRRHLEVTEQILRRVIQPPAEKKGANHGASRTAASRRRSN